MERTLYFSNREITVDSDELELVKLMCIEAETSGMYVLKLVIEQLEKQGYEHHLAMDLALLARKEMLAIKPGG